MPWKRFGARDGLDNTQASRLAYALGFAHESNGDHDRAFHYMSEAHRLLGKSATASISSLTAKLCWTT